MGRTLSKSIAFTLAAGAFAAPAAVAELPGEFSGNVALTTDYVWRGISQSDSDFAIQGGFDYSIGNFYAGTWASSVNFDDGADVDPDIAPNGTSTELDVYAGFAGELEGGLAWDVGVIGYFYPSDSEDLDFEEVYAGLGYSLAGLDLGAYVYQDFDNENTYVEGSVGYGISDAISVDASVGNYSFDEGEDYVNYSVGATYSFDWADIDLRYWDTDIDPEGQNDEGRVVLTVSRSL